MATNAGIFRTGGYSVLCLTLAVAIAAIGDLASAQSSILYTRQQNADYPPASSAPDTWTGPVCSSNGKLFPYGSLLEWQSILDRGQDAEQHLVAVSGTTVYNPAPGESGYCQGGDPCPGQPVSCQRDQDCSACGGACDLGQGPSCTCDGQGSSCSCPSPWGDERHRGHIACVSDAQCESCHGTCVALGRSRGDVPMSHPFGLDFDAAIVPDAGYVSLLARGNRVGGCPSGRCGEPNIVGHATAARSERTCVTGDNPGAVCVTDADCPITGACSSVNGQCVKGDNPGAVCVTDADCQKAACSSVFGLGLGDVQGMLVHGTLGLETDHDLLPDAYQPKDGDRTAAFGRWIVDCGEPTNGDTTESHTEIHPPLLLATGRSTGVSARAASSPCSDEKTCSTVIGRPYLVGQQYLVGGKRDGSLLVHGAHEVAKVGCAAATCSIINGVTSELGFVAGLPIDCDPDSLCHGDLDCLLCEAFSCSALGGGLEVPLGPPCTTRLEAHPQIYRVPFAGTQQMQYFVQPASPRVNPGDRMLAEWHFTVRPGVEVALADEGDDGVRVDVTMNASDYVPAPLPRKLDWTLYDGYVSRYMPYVGDGLVAAGGLPLLDLILPGSGAAFAGTIGGVAGFIAPFGPDIATVATIGQRGVLSDRYAAPTPPSNDGVQAFAFADEMSSVVQRAVVDDRQPFPVSGWLDVGWFRCTAGGPYVAECTGPTTTVALSGVGSRDPSGDPITFAWSGPFVGGSVAGSTPSVQFTGTGSFPVRLAVADAETSTTCSTSATVRDTVPPAITVTLPAATQYAHDGMLTLRYAVADVCTGVKSTTPTMDGATTLAGHGLQSGQTIDLLTELTLGAHTFAIDTVDGAGNPGSSSVTFMIIVTPSSIADDVARFLAKAAIRNRGLATSLLAKLDAAARARARGDCSGNTYRAFINELRAQSGKGVDGAAATIMIADGDYLIAHCP